MAIQLLRDCRVAISRGGTFYPLDAIGDITISSSISQVSIPRKTLFNNTSRPLMVTGKVNPTAISLTLNISQNSKVAGILLELLGLVAGNGGYEYLRGNSRSPELFELVVFNKDTTLSATPCFFESIDISLTKDNNLTFDCAISAANIQVDVDRKPIHNIDYTAVAHTHISLNIGGVVHNRVRSASISIQQVCSWVDDKNLFSSTSTYKHSLAVLTDRLVSANATVNYDGELINKAEVQHLELGQSGLKLTIENARITSNFDLDSIYTVRYDCYVTEESGLVLLTLANNYFVDPITPDPISPTGLTYNSNALTYNGNTLVYTP